ncbi:MAG: PIN domain-containing protein [Rubrivivax sp.]
MSLPVVADADTLFAATTRGLLIYLDYEGLIRLHWSPLILDELGRALVDTGRKKTAADAKAHEQRMRDALPNALVSVKAVQAHFGRVAAAVRSAKDLHVAACAYSLAAARAYPHAHAVALITRNTRDFSKAGLARLGIALEKPDAFLTALFQRQPPAFAAAFHRFRTDLTSGPAAAELLARLRRDGLPALVRALDAAQRAGVVTI